MARRNVTDPSRHMKRPKRMKRAKSRRVGPSASEQRAAPREHGHRTAVPRRPREGQPPGHVGAR